MTPPAEMLSCPACGAEVREHSPADREDYEFWRFACGGSVINMVTHMLAESPCSHALINALRRPTPPAAPELMRLAEAWVDAAEDAARAEVNDTAAIYAMHIGIRDEAKAAFTAALGRPAQGDEK